MPKELAKTNLEAGQIVAHAAIQLAPKGPHQGGGNVAPIASTIKALSQQTGVAVVAGGARAPHAAPTEFGGTLRRFHSRKKTHVRKRSFLYAAAEQKMPEVARKYLLMLDDLLTRFERG